MEWRNEETCTYNFYFARLISEKREKYKRKFQYKNGLITLQIN